MSCHAEFLRVAQSNDDRLARAVLHEPVDGLVDHAGDARQRALIELVLAVTREPWTLSPDDRERWHALGDDDLVHAIALSSYFGHLNRIADAVAVPLDYTVAIAAPRVDRSIAALAAAPEGSRAKRGELVLEHRPATATAIAAWRAYLDAKPGPLARDARVQIARWVAGWLGDAVDDTRDAAPDPDLRRLAELVTLAPWQLDDETFGPLRARGFDDSTLFDACITASSAGAFSRITVALAGLSA